MKGHGSESRSEEGKLQALEAKVADLSEENARLRTLVESTNEGLAVFRDGQMVYYNATLRHLAGDSGREVRLEAILKALAPDDRDLALERLRRAAELREVQPERFMRVTDPGGREHWLASTITPVQWENRPAALGSVRDVTAQVRAAQALRESEEKYRHLVEHAPAIIYEIDWLSGKLLSVNPAACSFLGYSADELLEMNGFDVIADEHRGVLKERIEQVNSGRDVPGPVEYRVKTRDGSEAWMLLHLRVVHRTGASIRAVGVAQDITELKRLERELRRVDKLRSLGVLAGGIAHDFNNILTAVLANVSVARSRAVRGLDVAQLLSQSEQACVRARELTRKLLTFSEGGTPVKEAVAVHRTLKECSELVLSGSRVSLELCVDEHIWPIEADQAQLCQVVNNLVINARQAMPVGGSIRVGAKNVGQAPPDLPLSPGRYVCLSFEDEGDGIPRANLARIFDPFFSTKEQGSGLGLATAFSIVKKHDGHITVDSEVGAGSTFFVYLPASTEQPAEPSDAVARPSGGRGRVLFMDDDEAIRAVADHMLRELGYEPSTAADGQQAVELFEAAWQAKSGFDLVIMDLTVPGGIGAREAVQRMKQIDPGVRAIVSSGYWNDPVLDEPSRYGFCETISKPFSLVDLGIVLERACKV